MSERWTLTCAHCGKRFTIKLRGKRFHGKRSKRYHSEACATAARMARMRARKRSILALFPDAGAPVIGRYETCDHCGEDFLTVSPGRAGGGERLYCRPPKTCAEDAEQLRRKMRYGP